MIVNYNVLAAEAEAAVEGFGLFGLDTAAFEPSLCLDWLFSTFAHCLFVSASPRKAFFLPTEENTH